LEEAFFGYDSVIHFEDVGRVDAFLELSRRSWRSRGFSDFWAHMLVAEGALDVAVHAEPGPKLWDLLPALLIVEEAGGRFTDLSGRRTAEGGSAVSTNGHLHERALAILNGR
jgi:histidinol-phosphatase